MQALSTDRPAPRVLLVDDDSETLVLLRAALEGEGIDVVGVAGDGSEAVALAEQTDPYGSADGPADAGHGRIRVHSVGWEDWLAKERAPWTHEVAPLLEEARRRWARLEGS